MGIRRKSRELALQYLFQCEMNPAEDHVDIEEFRKHFRFKEKAVPFGRLLISGVLGNKKEIDHLIEQHAHNWRLNRMTCVDRNILRIAVFELVFAKEPPASVVLNEAIEIAQSYSDEDAGSFINGILDAVCNVRESE